MLPSAAGNAPKRAAKRLSCEDGEGQPLAVQETREMGGTISQTAMTIRNDGRIRLRREIPAGGKSSPVGKRRARKAALAFLSLPLAAVFAAATTHLTQRNKCGRPRRQTMVESTLEKMVLGI